MVFSSKSAFLLVVYIYPKIKKSRKKYEKINNSKLTFKKLSFIQCTVPWWAVAGAATVPGSALDYANKEKIRKVGEECRR